MPVDIPEVARLLATSSSIPVCCKFLLNDLILRLSVPTAGLLLS